MQAERIRHRSRLLTDDRKSQLCALVAQSNTIESAAAALGVSLRTVQRERKLNEQFDGDVRRALGASPDPLKLMETAARTHWRAAAWLLERTRPEQYGRRPANAASHARVSRALSSLLNAVLEKLPAEQRSELLAHADEALEQALDSCFPQRSAPKVVQAFQTNSPADQPAIPAPVPNAPSKSEASPPAPRLAPGSSNRGAADATTEITTICHEAESPDLRPLTNNERKRRQRQAAQLSRKMKRATRKQNRRAA